MITIQGKKLTIIADPAKATFTVQLDSGATWTLSGRPLSLIHI